MVTFLAATFFAAATFLAAVSFLRRASAAFLPHSARALTVLAVFLHACHATEARFMAWPRVAIFALRRKSIKNLSQLLAPRRAAAPPPGRRSSSSSDS